jgi:hypothetical protein
MIDSGKIVKLLIDLTAVPSSLLLAVPSPIVTKGRPSERPFTHWRGGGESFVNNPPEVPVYRFGDNLYCIFPYS